VPGPDPTRRHCVDHTMASYRLAGAQWWLATQARRQTAQRSRQRWAAWRNRTTAALRLVAELAPWLIAALALTAMARRCGGIP